MGLDVTAHKNVRLSPITDFGEIVDWCEESDELFVEAFVITDHWLNRISDLKNGRFYIPDESERLISYRYSYHSFLRSEICKMIGVREDSWKEGTLPEGSDFEEWLNFADNEGCISWTTCKKLANDFKKWHTKAKELDKDWLTNYENWMKAFEYASENGIVEYQ